jgi:hypothetical protein
MPKQQTGPAKFGSEHDIRPDKVKKELSADELRKKAEHYQDNSDK